MFLVPSIISEHGNTAFSLHRLETSGMALSKKSPFRCVGGDRCAEPRNNKAKICRIPSASMQRGFSILCDIQGQFYAFVGNRDVINHSG